MGSGNMAGICYFSSFCSRQGRSICSHSYATLERNTDIIEDRKSEGCTPGTGDYLNDNLWIHLVAAPEKRRLCLKGNDNPSERMQGLQVINHDEFPEIRPT